MRSAFNKFIYCFRLFIISLFYKILRQNAMDNTIRRTYWYTVLVVFAVKAMLAAAIPLISDEAYFVIWAQHPDFGYYDHPPMVAWFLKAMLYFGHSELILRLPAVLSTIFIGIGIFLLLRKLDEKKAYIASALFLVSPVNLLYIPISTDTPVILFAFVSGCFMYLAREKDSYAHYALSGAFLGMAFLSKYFAALLGFAYLVYFLITPKSRKGFLGLMLTFAAAAPFICVNLYWNYTHSWANLLFNLVNRNQKESFSLGKFLTFIISQAYLITPPVLYYIIRKRREALNGLRNSGRYGIFAVMFAAPLAVFLLLSFKKVIGLHWALAFYPFMYVAAFFALSEEDLVKSLKFMLVFSLLHLVAIGTLLTLPLDTFKNNRNYNMVVMGMRPESVISELKKYEGGFEFSTESYAESAVIAYYSGRYYFVFGGGSHHGRQDDMITDFREYAGKNILILRKAAPVMENYAPYFRKVEVKQFEAEKTIFYVVLGYGFKYEPYRETVLKGIKDNYYRIPSWLPCKTDYFSKKYFITANSDDKAQMTK